MSREPANRRSRTHSVSPCRTTKSLSLATTPPFYPDSPNRHVPPGDGLAATSAARSSKSCDSGDRVTEPTRGRAPPGDRTRAPPGRADRPPPTARKLKRDELGENDVRHRPDFVESGRRHGIVEIQHRHGTPATPLSTKSGRCRTRSEEHTSELQSRPHLVCRLLL